MRTLGRLAFRGAADSGRDAFRYGSRPCGFRWRNSCGSQRRLSAGRRGADALAHEAVVEALHNLGMLYANDAGVEQDDHHPGDGIGGVGQTHALHGSAPQAVRQVR